MKKSRVLGALVFACFILLVTLGTWQVKRLAWKTELIEQLEKRVEQSPIAIEDAIRLFTDGDNVEYQPVRVHGTFLHKTEKHLYALDHNGRPGWHIYTLMQVTGRDCKDCPGQYRFVYINRGFVPYALKNRSKRPQGQVSAARELVGLVRVPRSAKRFADAANQPAKNQWYWPSIKDMIAVDAHSDASRARDLAPVFVDERAAVRVEGRYFGKYNGKFYQWPRAGVTRIKLQNRHLGYVITWYGLALALLGVYGFFLYGTPRKGNGERT